MRAMNMLWAVIILLVAGCGTVATPSFQATALIRDARGTATAIVRQAQVTGITSPTASAMTIPTSTDTPIPTQPTITNTPASTHTPTATITPTITNTAVPTMSTASEVASGDAANGEVLFNTFQPAASFACATCHLADSEDRLIGPGLLNISVRADTRIEGLSAVEYIRQSITDPSAYIVESFPDGLMPQNWVEIYNEEEIDDIIAYLMTLQE